MLRVGTVSIVSKYRQLLIQPKFRTSAESSLLEKKTEVILTLRAGVCRRPLCQPYLGWALTSGHSESRNETTAESPMPPSNPMGRSQTSTR